MIETGHAILAFLAMGTIIATTLMGFVVVLLRQPTRGRRH